MFANELGLWALLSLVPFIILYLRKPRPENKTIPSLMFLIKDRKTSHKYAFLRKIMHNLLFLIQLLALILLSVSVAAPFITAPYDVTLENTVIILDTSASMQAGDRFSDAVKKARSSLSGRNSIILAENIPLIVLEDETTDAAIEVLGKIKAKSTTTNIEDAMLLGKDLIKEKSGKIVVISDFASVDSADLLVVKKSLANDDLAVDFIDVSDDTKNIGITKLDLRKHSMKVYIQNFHDEEISSVLKLKQGGEELSSSGEIKILPKSVESFEFTEVPAGISTINLEPGDDFKVDDTVYISTPLKKYINVLLITNEQGSNLEKALGASKDINLNVIDLYKSPALNFNTDGENIEPFDHDIIIIHKMNKPGDRGGMLLSGFSDIKNYINKGGKVIFTAQSNTETIKLDYLLDELDLIKINSLSTQADKVCTDIINEFTKQFEKDICFASTGKYFYSEKKDDAISIASTTSKNPIITLRDIGKGKALFYGIFDDDSEFKTLPSYPIFWNSLANFMAETKDIDEFNFNAGKVLTISEQKVKTPSGSLTTSKLIMDEAGIYEVSGNKYAVNLLDQEESDLQPSLTVEEEEKKESALQKERKEHDFPISPLLLLIALILLTIETIYIKRRGDI